MSLRLEEKQFEIDGKVYVLRCNMAVLEALSTAYGSFQAVMDLPMAEGLPALLAAMLNDYAEDMGWEQSWTARKIKKRYSLAGLMELGILGMFNRAITPETADAGDAPATGKTEPGDDSGN